MVTPLASLGSSQTFFAIEKNTIGRPLLNPGHSLGCNGSTHINNNNNNNNTLTLL